MSQAPPIVSPPPPGRHLVVATHGYCFDGLCSAVMFTRLMRHVHGSEPLRFTYYSAGYGPGQNGVAPDVLAGDENAILDFRFSTSPKLTWYFDHHVSAFPTTSDRALYDQRVATESSHGKGERRSFHDGTYGSCTKLIADVGRASFDLDYGNMTELVRWADLIDSASFPSAEMAVARKEPELGLMAVVENLGNEAFLSEYVPRLLEEPLAEVASSLKVREAFEPLKATQEIFVQQVTKNARVHGPVVFVDLTDEVIEVAGKFVTYALYPKSAYSVTLSRSKSKNKISVGYNPWSGITRIHDIAKICERYGGGGHPVVGAIALAVGDVAAARKVAMEIVATLGSPTPDT
jgi:hypothetical protein